MTRAERHGRVIAIDGPSGAGKSSVARAIARRLGFLHVDSGALYRIITWQCIERGVDLDDPAAIARAAGEIDIECRPEDGRISYRVGGEEPGDRIRTPQIDANSSKIAREKPVRDKVTALLRSLARFGDIAVEGRDITTAVFPDTPARLYLTASAEARAARRRRQQEGMGVAAGSVADVKAALAARDAMDSTRKYAPLRKADGAVEIDSSDLTLDETIEAAMAALPEGWRGEGR